VTTTLCSRESFKRSAVLEHVAADLVSEPGSFAAKGNDFRDGPGRRRASERANWHHPASKALFRAVEETFS
jgi:hypothetical protein